MLGTVVLIILVLLLVGGLFPVGWPGPGPVAGAQQPIYHGYGYGWGGGSILGTLLLVALILFLLGML